MKKIGWMIVALSLSLSVAALAGSIGDQPKVRKTPPESKAVRGGEVRAPKTLADQIAQLKQEHQAAINELQEIRKLATEEKATKTAGALDKLIARRNQEFQTRIQPLQQRLNKLEAQSKGGGNEPKTEGSKDKPKNKNKGTPQGQ